MTAHGYWEERARMFARAGGGLGAVCSYGMPLFYNAEIHLTQFLALSPHLRDLNGRTLLDLGCGVGRWSRMAARRGAAVTGVDLSATMVEETQRRVADEGLGDRCRFQIGDASTFDAGRTFDRVLTVTVLQHILDPGRFDAAVATVARHLAPGGRAVILEAAPSRRNATCDTGVFTARTADDYLVAFEAAGLVPVSISGVDPAPFKTRILPLYRDMRRGLRELALLGVTLASLPIDVLAGRRFVSASWHKVFVLRHATESRG